MRVETDGRFQRRLSRMPRAVEAWAQEWIDAVQRPDATPDSVAVDSKLLRGKLNGWRARKFRDHSQGEYRLVFQIRDDDEVFILSVGPRGSVYEDAARRLK